MKCARIQELFSAYAENTLEPPLKVAFEQHMAECADCRELYEKFNATMMLLDEMPEMDVPEGFHAAIMARVAGNTQVQPHPVKWWHLDWQHVFTVKVPARALAVGVAALLVVGVVSLNTKHTPGASLIPGTGSPVSSIQTEPDGPRIPTHTGDISKSGLNVGVSVGSEGNTLRFKAESKEIIKVDVYVMPASAVSTDAPGTHYYSGFVQSKQDAFVGINSGEATALRVVWTRDDQAQCQYIFLPSRVSDSAENRSLALRPGSAYSAFRQISEIYGVVIIASGDLSKNIKYTGGSSQSPSDAVFEVSRSLGLSWSGLAKSMYSVQPAL